MFPSNAVIRDGTLSTAFMLLVSLSRFAFKIYNIKKNISLFVSGRKKAVQPAPSGSIAAPVYSDYFVISSDDFLYRQIVHGKAGVAGRVPYFSGRRQ